MPLRARPAAVAAAVAVALAGCGSDTGAGSDDAGTTEAAKPKSACVEVPARTIAALNDHLTIGNGKITEAAFVQRTEPPTAVGYIAARLRFDDGEDATVYFTVVRGDGGKFFTRSIAAADNGAEEWTDYRVNNVQRFTDAGASIAADCL